MKYSRDSSAWQGGWLRRFTRAVYDTSCGGGVLSCVLDAGMPAPAAKDWRQLSMAGLWRVRQARYRTWTGGADCPVHAIPVACINPLCWWAMCMWSTLKYHRAMHEHTRLLLPGSEEQRRAKENPTPGKEHSLRQL